MTTDAERRRQMSYKPKKKTTPIVKWSGKADTRTGKQLANTPSGTSPGTATAGTNYGLGSKFTTDFDGRNIMQYKTPDDYGGVPPGAGLPKPPGGNPPGGNNGGGGGGPAINTAAIMGALNRFRPQKFTYTDLNLPDYVPPEFYGFDSSTYDLIKQSIADGLGLARQSGAAAYGEAREQMNALPMGFQSAPTTTDPGMSSAMQRMYEAQGIPTSINERTMNEGVQADQAFGNLYAILGENARQGRASDMRAIGGDERRMNENLDMQGLQLNTGVDLALAQARRQYEIDKWTFGEGVARTNWEKTLGEITANNQGLNQANQANTQMVNDANQAAMNAMVELLASGVAIDPNSYRQVV